MGRLLDRMRAALRSGGASEQVDAVDAAVDQGAESMIEQLLEQSVANAEVDPDDPDFAPVQGVDVDRYAKVCRALVDGGAKDRPAMDAILVQHGVDPASWPGVAEVWNERVLRSAKVKLRYSATFIG